MKCYCCDKILTPRQSTRRFKESEEFVDMCDECLNSIDDFDIDTIESDYAEDGLFDENGNPKEEL